MITIAAPPGYGKTSLLASIADSYKNGTIWVTVPKLDASAALFWKEFVESAAAGRRLFAKRISRLGFPDSPEKFDSFVSYLSDEAARAPVFIVVDDCDNFLGETAESGESVNTFLEKLVEREIGYFCLALCASASSALVRFEKLGNSGRALRLSMDDLKLTPDEAAEMIKMREWAILPREAEWLLERTEGWPDAFARACMDYVFAPLGGGRSGSHITYMNELFQSDYFGGFEASAQNVLLKLALSSRFSMDLVLKLAPAYVKETFKILRESPFTIVLPQCGAFEMLRFHNVYREFLLSRMFLLGGREKKEAGICIGDWFKSLGMHKEAIESYHGAGEFGMAVGALTEVPNSPRIDSEFAGYAIGLLEQLPELYRGDASIELSRAFYYMNNMEMDTAQGILLGLIRRLETEKPGDRAIMGEAYAALADIDLLRHNVRFAEYVKLACSLLPNGSAIQSGKIITLGNDSAFFLPRGGGMTVEKMVALIFECAPMVEKVYNKRRSGFEFLFSAEAAYLSLDMEKAEENCYKAIYKAAENGQHDVVCNSRYILSRIAGYYGDFTEAEGQLRLISEYIEERELTELYELRDTVWGAMHILACNPEKVASWIAEGHESSYVGWPTPPSRRKLIRAYYLMSVRKCHEASALLLQLENSKLECGLCMPRLFAAIMRSVCSLRLGDKEGALEAFHLAYCMVRGTQIAAPFIEFGKDARTLAENARKLGEERFDPVWLDNIQSKAGTFAKNIASLARMHAPQAGRGRAEPVRLTRRELEVLAFLANGMTRREIGDYMQISVNGVKKHVNGIYNKLGARGKADAIKMASDLGIL